MFVWNFEVETQITLESNILHEFTLSEQTDEEASFRAGYIHRAVYQNKQPVQSGQPIDFPAKYNLFHHHKSVSDICTKPHFSQTLPSKAVYSPMAWLSPWQRSLQLDNCNPAFKHAHS